jgi:beta-lactam-binding protein with PASTA domain
MIRVLSWCMALLVLCSNNVMASSWENKKIAPPSNSPVRVTVPHVVGKEVGEASRILTAANLRYSVSGDLKGKSGAEIKKMKVGKQMPAAGEKVYKNQYVWITPEGIQAKTTKPEGMSPDEKNKLEEHFKSKTTQMK